MNQFNTTCAVTGKKENLTMHAVRNESGEMIGWVFLNEEVSKDVKNLTVNIAYEQKIYGQVIPGLSPIHLDFNPHG